MKTKTRKQIITELSNFYAEQGSEITDNPENIILNGYVGLNSKNDIDLLDEYEYVFKVKVKLEKKIKSVSKKKL